jgi:hypothetical protein
VFLSAFAESIPVGDAFALDTFLLKSFDDRANQLTLSNGAELFTRPKNTLD